MALPQEFLLQLHDRNEITELVGSYVDLKLRSRIYTGLCPFHNEKTPSFTVYPDTQSFYCFGCGAGGDAITFIKMRENLDYIESVRFLAARAGIEMPEETRDGSFDSRKRILEANKLAARFFFDALNTEEGKNARAYLRRRGLGDAVIKRFGLGYAPDSWDGLKKHLNEKGYRNEELTEAGLCTINKSGTGVYDFFRNRLMFPVIDVRGNVIAFSGRTLGDDSRKYINTRETPVFTKSRTLYALNIAKTTDIRRIIVAEGQMDVIAIHQAGFDNAVAALGTALTAEHARMVAQYADEVVLAYDADEAGQKAVHRAIDIFKNTKLLVKVIDIKGAKDPDEYIKNHGADHFRNLLDNSGNSIEYEIRRAKLKYDTETDSGRVQYLGECAAILARTPSPTERDLYAGRVAEQAGVSKSALLLQIEQNRRRENTKRQKEEGRRFAHGLSEKYGAKGKDARGIGAVAAERRLIALLFYNPDLCGRIGEQIAPEDFVSDEARTIYQSLAQTINDDRFSGLGSMSQELESNMISIMSGILAENSGINFTAEDADFLIDKILRTQGTPDAEKIKQMDAGELKKKIDDKKAKTMG